MRGLWQDLVTLACCAAICLMWIVVLEGWFFR